MYLSSVFWAGLFGKATEPPRPAITLPQATGSRFRSIGSLMMASGASPHMPPAGGNSDEDARDDNPRYPNLGPDPDAGFCPFCNDEGDVGALCQVCSNGVNTYEPPIAPPLRSNWDPIRRIHYPWGRSNGIPHSTSHWSPAPARGPTAVPQPDVLPDHHFLTLHLSMLAAGLSGLPSVDDAASMHDASMHAASAPPAIAPPPIGADADSTDDEAVPPPINPSYQASNSDENSTC